MKNESEVTAPPPEKKCDHPKMKCVITLSGVFWSCSRCGEAIGRKKEVEG